MQTDLLEKRLVHELNVIYNAKKLYLEAQHRVRQTRNEALMKMLVEKIDETGKQIRNLNLIFTLIDRQPEPFASEVTTDLIAEAQTQMQKTAINPAILEVVIIEAQIKMKKFEISLYRSLVEGMEQLKQVTIRYLIAENLQQEEQILKQLEQYF